ncbi:MAG: hypothetical protein ING50_01400 [Burkholderiales bacterium]|jgi:hypothetical protein|nr:hypothetical protein [Burkholderiales bacterium]
MRLLNAKRLAVELGRGEVSSREKGYYLFAGFVMWLLIGASGFTTVSPLWTWMSLIETAALIVVYLLGFSYAYDSAGGDENPDFVVQFTCLYVPVSITTVAAVWGLYWATAYGFRESINALSDSHLQFAVNLGRIGSNVFGALVTLAVLVVEAVTFYRVTKLFVIVRAQAQSVNSSLQAAPASGRA